MGSFGFDIFCGALWRGILGATVRRFFDLALFLAVLSEAEYGV